MTNGEAVSCIKFLLDVGGSDRFTSSDREALNAAINALSEPKTPNTNGDRIRQMTDEELAKFIFHVTDCCSKGWQWCEDCPLNGAGEFCEVDEFTEYFGKEVGE